MPNISTWIFKKRQFRSPTTKCLDNWTKTKSPDTLQYTCRKVQSQRSIIPGFFWDTSCLKGFGLFPPHINLLYLNILCYSHITFPCTGFIIDLSCVNIFNETRTFGFYIRSVSSIIQLQILYHHEFLTLKWQIPIKR